MKKLHALVLSTFFCLNTEGSIAQTQSRFKAGVLAGANFSQIHGDSQDGYTKKGLSLGLTGSMMIAPDFDICTELLYNEKGAAAQSPAGQVLNYYSSDISLKYSEVALLGHYFFMPRLERNYYAQSIKIGFSYGKLLKSRTTVSQNQKQVATVAQTLTQNYNKNDFSFVAAWSFYFSPRVNVSVRHTNTLSFLFKTHASIEKEAFQNMRPYYFSFHLGYDFIAPKKVVVGRRKKKNKPSTLEEV